MIRHKILAIVVAGIVGFSVVGGIGLSAAAMSASTAPMDTGDTLTGIQEGDGAQNQTVSLVAAMEVAANETATQNGTVVGAERGQSEGLLDFDDDGENVYTIDVLLANGTYLEVGVNATTGAVVATEEEDDDFLDDIFGDDDAPDESLNVSAMRTAIEAVQLVQNETDVNGTITEVELETDDGRPVYEVEIDQASDGDRTVVVAAVEDEGGIIETDD